MDRLTVNDLRPCIHGKDCKHTGSCTYSSTLFNDMNKNPHKYYNVIEENKQVLDCKDLYEPFEQSAPRIIDPRPCFNGRACREESFCEHRSMSLPKWLSQRPRPLEVINFEKASLIQIQTYVCNYKPSEVSTPPEETRQVLDCKNLYEPSEAPAPELNNGGYVGTTKSLCAPEVIGYQAEDCGTHYKAEPIYKSVPPTGGSNIKPAGQIASEERAKLKEQIEQHVYVIDSYLTNSTITSDQRPLYHQAKSTALLALATLATKGD